MNSINKCGICGSTNINTTHNVGSDIWPGGEEEQHLNRCLDCQATLLWADVYIYDKLPFSDIIGKWKPYDPEWEAWPGWR